MMRSCLRRSPRYAGGNSCSLLLFFVCLFAFNLFCLLFLIFVTILMKLTFHPPPQKKTIKVIIIIMIIIIAIAIIVRVIFDHRLGSSLICLERVIVFLVYLSNAQHFLLNSFWSNVAMMHVLLQSNVAYCRSFLWVFYSFTGCFFSTSSNVHLA